MPYVLEDSASHNMLMKLCRGSLPRMDALYSAVFDGVPLTPLDKLFWVSLCGSCVFP